jgi:hypothetical protein
MIPHLMPPSAEQAPQASRLATSGLLTMQLHTLAIEMNVVLRWMALSALACLLLSKPLSLAEVAHRVSNHSAAGN